MKKIQKKSMFFFRILKLIWNKKNKKAARALEKSAFKVFIQTHDWVLWGIKYALPFILTVLLIVITLDIVIFFGFRFSSVINGIMGISIGSIVVFWLFYEIIKDYIKQHLK